MDPMTLSFFVGIVSGVISNALYKSVTNSGNSALKFLFDGENVEDIIRKKIDFETIIEEKITFEAFPGLIELEPFRRFLESDEVFAIVQKIYDTNILLGDNFSNLSSAKQDFSNLFVKYLEIDKTQELIDLGPQLFDLLIEACDRSLTDIIKDNNILLAHEVQSKYRFKLLHDNNLSLHDDIKSLEKNINEIKAGFESEYQFQLESLRENIKENNPTEALKRIVNLKSRIWEKSSSSVKYALLSIEASANLMLNRYQDAGKLLIEAFRYSDIEKAIVNAAYGYFLLGECPTSKELVLEILKKNPNNARASSILVQMFTSEEEIDDISDYLKETQYVAYAIGNFFSKIEKFGEAIKWLKIAIDNEEEAILEMRPFLASILLDTILSESKKIHEFQLSENDKNTFKNVIDLITVSWNSISDSNLHKIHVHWIVNRGIAKHLLGNLEGSKDDINDAFKLNPSDSRVIYFKALMELEHDEIEKAIYLLEDIVSDKSIPEALLLYFDLLRKQGKFTVVIAEINDFLEQNEDFQKIDSLYRILIYSYLDSYPDLEDCIKKANELAENRLKNDPTNIEKIIDISRCLAKSGQMDPALSHLNNVKSSISNSTPTFHMMELADEFFRLKSFEDASEIYEKFVDSSQVTDLTHKLIESYFRCGDIGKALEICKSLRDDFGPITHITNTEIVIYHEIGDLSEAKKVLIEYIGKYPDDMNMKLDLTFLNLRCNNLGDVDDFLKTSFSINSFSIENGIRLALLFNERGNFKEAIDILYEIRRYNFENENAHIAYIKLILLNDQEKHEKWLNPEKIDADTTVTIEDKSGHQMKYTLENRIDIDFQKGEIELESTLAKLIYGKTKGSKVMQKNHFSQEILEINDIKSKYIHAFQESLDKFNYMFPETQALEKISLPKNDDGEISPESLQNIKDITRLRSEHNSKAVEKYLKKELTIGSLANIMNQNVFDIWFEFTKYADLGINCAIGSNPERTEALSNLENSSKLIADPLSLITLFTLNVGDIIRNCIGKLGIAQSTIDLLQETLIDQNGTYSRKHGILIYDEGELIFKEVDPKDVQEKINLYEQMLDWISKNCEIIPCKKALSIRRGKKKECYNVLGRAFVDTILIATENDNILYTEDKVLSLIAKQKFDVDGIWTQVLLSHCLKNNVIDKDHYNELTIKLANLHYHHTSINQEILVEAAKKANWKVKYPLKKVLSLLSGKYCDEKSALIASTYFLSTIWNEEIPIQDLYILVMNLLNTIVQGRFSPSFIDKLKNRVNINIHLFSAEDRDGILELIRLWEIIYYKSIF